MDALDVGVEVAFSVVGLVAAVARTIEHGLGSRLCRQDTVSYLEVPGQLLVCPEGREALLASGRMNNRIVLLQLMVASEESWLES